MNSKLMHIEFYFPQKKEGIKSKDGLASLIVEEIKESGAIEYNGFLNEKDLYTHILQHIGDVGISNYKILTSRQKNQIKKIIDKIAKKCDTLLTIPTTNYVFVLPWQPTKNEEDFNGVMGFAPYSCVFYLFLSPNTWSPKSLADSVIHELNHTIYYYYHYDDFNNYTLLDELVMEGLAENFREKIADSKPAPWSIALTKKDAFSALHSIDGLLDSRDEKIIKKILFGSETYKKWTGYSIGYWVVKEFLKKNDTFSWNEIMKMQSEDILESIR